MKVLSKQEGVTWCYNHGVVLNDRELPDLSGAEFKFGIPNDAQKRIYLAKQAVCELSNAPSVLVWFNDWSVWPSGQRMHIFDRLRISYGDARPIVEAPAQLFEQMEIEDAISFVTIAVLFLWDCYVVCPNKDRFVFFSHDEYGVVKGMDFHEQIPWLNTHQA